MRHKYLVVHSCDGAWSEIPFSTFKSARAEFMLKDREMKVKSYLWVDEPVHPSELAFRLAVACNGLIVGQVFNTRHRRLYHINMAWRETENRSYIELSVTPTDQLTKG